LTVDLQGLSNFLFFFGFIIFYRVFGHYGSKMVAAKIIFPAVFIKRGQILVK
jgi:hypothetical protein